VAIWYILWQLGIFYGYLVYLFSFGYLVPWKIWQPSFQMEALDISGQQICMIVWDLREGGGNKRVVVGVSVSYVHTLCVSSSSVFCDNIISAGRHLFGPFRHANQRKTKARSGNEISGKSTLGMDDSSHKFYDLRHFIHNITVMFP
jgi:hypothetical protein